MGHSVTEEYFSGQGVVLIGTRDINGKPAGLRPVGNVPALSIKNATSVLEHKESTTGARGTDKRLTTEIKVTLDMTLENFNSKNLAAAVRGAVSQIAGGAVTAETVAIFPGMISPLANMKVSSVVVTTATAYTNSTTAYDYQPNLEAGSLRWNDGSVVGFGTAGVAATAITPGATTEVTITHDAAIGDTFYFGQGWAGADADQVNGKWGTIVDVTGTTALEVALDTTGATITVGTNKCLWSGKEVTVAYNFVAQQEVGAFTTGQPEMYLRFEGLNTAEADGPVVVEVFRFTVDPTQDLSLISDGLQQFVLSGSVLKDSKQLSGSQYYRVRKIDLV